MLANYLINKLLKLQFVSGFGGYRPISRVVIGREVDYRSRLIYVRYSLTNTTLCL